VTVNKIQRWQPIGNKLDDAATGPADLVRWAVARLGIGYWAQGGTALGTWWWRDTGGLVAARLAAGYWAQGSAALGARWWHGARRLVATWRGGWGWSQGQGGRADGRLAGWAQGQGGRAAAGRALAAALGSDAGRDAAT
jgi:hypothetical protein